MNGNWTRLARFPGSSPKNLAELGYGHFPDAPITTTRHRQKLDMQRRVITESCRVQLVDHPDLIAQYYVHGSAIQRHGGVLEIDKYEISMWTENYKKWAALGFECVDTCYAIRPGTYHIRPLLNTKHFRASFSRGNLELFYNCNSTNIFD